MQLLPQQVFIIAKKKNVGEHENVSPFVNETEFHGHTAFSMRASTLKIYVFFLICFWQDTNICII